MEEDEGETAAQQQQQQQQSGGPLQPVPFLNVTASMAGDPNTTVNDKAQLHASLHSQVGHTTPGSSTPVMLLSQSVLSTAGAANHS